ncbi:unnamed protein product [Peniophora sp. CBMAI 1063]|nr:unnamed protein product [Peniophora sp. CBMAI 1063]
MLQEKRGRSDSAPVSAPKKPRAAAPRKTKNADWGSKSAPNEAAQRAQNAFESEKFRKVLWGPKKGENTSKISLTTTWNEIAIVVFGKDNIPEGELSAYGNKIKGLWNAYRKTYNNLAERIKQTGGGVRDPQIASLVSIEEKGSTRVLECYVPAEGPSAETPQKYKNIWEELTGTFAFFPRWHALQATRPSSNPPSVTTGLSPDRNGGHITTFYQPPPEDLVSKPGEPIPDELIDPQLRDVGAPDPDEPMHAPFEQLREDSDEEMPPVISRPKATKSAAQPTPRRSAPSQQQSSRPAQSTPRPSSAKKSSAAKGTSTSSQKFVAKPNPAQQSIEANKSKFTPLKRESIHTTIRSVVDTSAKEARAARRELRLTSEINRLRDDIRFLEERRDKRLATAREEYKDDLLTRDEFIKEKAKINKAIDDEVARLRKDMEHAQHDLENDGEDNPPAGSRTPSHGPDARMQREHSPSWGSFKDDSDIEDITDMMRGAKSSSPAPFDEDDVQF